MKRLVVTNVGLEMEMSQMSFACDSLAFVDNAENLIFSKRARTVLGFDSGRLPSASI